MTRALLVGLLVGGRGTRMGGAAKGLLTAPGTSERLVERLVRVCLEAIPGADVVLVGAANDDLASRSRSEPAEGGGGSGREASRGGPRPAATNPYAELGLAAIADDPRGVGPLGGLRALLLEGKRRDAAAIALACDLPRVTAELVKRLAAHAPEAAIVAPRTNGFWEPLFARYDPERVLGAVDRALTTPRRALGTVLDALGTGTVELPLDPGDAALLADWDTPEDVARGRQDPRP